MDGSSINDAQVAAEIWAASKPHAPASLLAYLYRQNLPFPVTGIPPVAPGLEAILKIGGWTVQRYGFEYFQFHCPDCRSSMFQPATYLGMAHARHVARLHKPSGCCDQRKALNADTVWPDSFMAD